MENPVAVVGAGVIGASWAALFLDKGLTVRVYDPKAVVFPPNERLKICATLEEAVKGAALVQECGPDDVALKRKLFSELVALAPGALLCSSTSAIPASVFTEGLADASRILVAHPFNPPRLIPLVEIVPSPRTSPQAVKEAVAFYAALGKTPVVLKKEIPGFAANRLQAALFKEAVSLVMQGVVTVEELDAVVTGSIGPRWAVAGPFETFHLGGGPGGLAAFFKHLGPALGLDEATAGKILEQSKNFQPYAQGAPKMGRRLGAVLAAVKTP